MGTTYLSSGIHSAGLSVFIATPAYEAVKPGYAHALAGSTAELTRYGIPFMMGIMEGNCHVDDGRNALVRDFLASPCTDLVFIDSDLRWTPNTLMKLLRHDEDFVCGAYPKKSDNTSYPIGRILNARPDGMLEVSFAPTGFMRIRRSVFTTLWPKVSRVGGDKPMAIFFERKFNGATRDGGDVTFCRRWIAAGGKVMVDPTLSFEHIGERRWSGSFIDYLAKPEHRAKHFDEKVDPAAMLTEKAVEKPLVKTERAIDALGIKRAIRKLQGGDFEAINDLADAWGNKPWAATPELLEIAYRTATNLPAGSTIIECGSGVSTLVLAAAAAEKRLKLITFEQEPQWAKTTQAMLDICGLDSRIICAPIEGDWYAATEHVAGLNAALAVIDGPRGLKDRSKRGWLFSQEATALGAIAPDAAVVIDDISWTGEATEAPTLFGAAGTWLKAGGVQGRSFAVGRLGPTIFLEAAE